MIYQAHKTFDQAITVTENARLKLFAINRNVLPLQCPHDKICDKRAHHLDTFAGHRC